MTEGTIRIIRISLVGARSAHKGLSPIRASGWQMLHPWTQVLIKGRGDIKHGPRLLQTCHFPSGNVLVEISAETKHGCKEGRAVSLEDVLIRPDFLPPRHSMKDLRGSLKHITSIFNPGHVPP